MSLDTVRKLSRSNIGWFVAVLEILFLLLIAVVFRASIKLDPGDLATWVSGMATLAAVIVALGVPAWQKSISDREKRHQRLFAAKLLAIEKIDLVVLLKIEVVEARKWLREAEHWHISQISQLIARAGIPGFLSLPSGAELLTLPEDIGPAVAACRATANMYNRSLNSLLERPELTTSERLANSAMNEMLDHVQAQLARLARLLSRFESSLAHLNFAERGDGTSIEETLDSQSR